MKFSKKNIVTWFVLAALAFVAVASLDARRRGGGIIYYQPPSGVGVISPN